MKKITIVLIVTMIISICLLNGCTQQDINSNNTSNGQDLDNDGNPDDSDLYEKFTIISGSEIFEQNEGIGAFFEVDDNCKFVIVNWEVTNPLDLTVDEQQDIILRLSYPPDISIDYPYDIANNRNLRFTIDSSNWGKWSYGFLNAGVISNVTIFREIYVLK